MNESCGEKPEKTPTKREAQAAIDARKAEGTQVPPPETPEQRDARLKATYEGYCKTGGPITREQLTEEMREWLSKNAVLTYVSVTLDEIILSTVAPCVASNAIPHHGVFWNEADAEHDHFLRTWKGPLTEEAAKKLRKGDRVWYVSTSGCHSLWGWNNSQEQHGWCKRGVAFLSEPEAKQAEQAALDKAKQPEHKFAEMPPWCPPLLDGAVPLGFGDSFKKIKGFSGWVVSKGDNIWEEALHIYGGITSFFYAAPRNSEIALLNYPWLKDESKAAAKSDMPETLEMNGRTYRRLPDGEPRKDGDIPVDGSQVKRFGPTYYRPTGEAPNGEKALDELTEQAQELHMGYDTVTIANRERQKPPSKLLSLANYKGTIPDKFNLDCKNFDFDDIQKLIRDNFVSAVEKKNTPKVAKKSFDLICSGDEIVGICWSDDDEGSYVSVDDAAIDLLRRHGKAPRDWKDIPQPLTPREPKQTVLEEAMKCVGGPRRRDYGTPDENFGRIADLWNAHLKGKLSKPVTPDDVAMLMILLKVARQANSPKRDNLVDIAGYAQCASELKEEK